MVNKITLIGNLGADPEVRTLENGTKVAKLNVATTEKYKDRNGEQQSQTEWHTVVVWRGLAEVVEKYFKKGMQVYIEGKLTHRKWEDNDGVTRYSTEVVARTANMLGRKNDGGNSGQNFPTIDNEPVSRNSETATPF